MPGDSETASSAQTQLKKDGHPWPHWLRASIPLGGGITKVTTLSMTSSLRKQLPFTCESQTSMSRLKISNCAQLGSLVSSVSDKASLKQHRGLVLIVGAPASFLDEYANLKSVQYLAPATISDRSDRISTLLGREFHELVHQLNEVIDPGLIAALCGTVVAGGVLVLGLPISHDGSTRSRFMQRFTRLLHKQAHLNPDTVRIAHWISRSDDETMQAQRTVPPIKVSSARTNKRHSMDAISIPQYKSALNRYEKAQAEQDLLYNQMHRFLSETDLGAVIITGRRGRGKTTLMARLAHSLNRRNFPFHCTSSQRTALQSFKRFNLDLSDSYLSPLKAITGTAAILLVDEAGSLSLNLLSAYLEHYSHVVFCTTVEGYETSGRAFELRFMETAKARYPDVLHLSPQQAWRWAPGDAIEALIDQWLLLSGPTINPIVDVTNTSANAHADNSVGSGVEPVFGRINVTQLDQESLAHDEPLLQAVFALLRSTHYQTTAQDLQHLLDSETTQIWIAMSRDQLLGVLLLALEGDIQPELHEAIVSKQRRLPHQLLPQLLAQFANQEKALSASYARVVRISVDPVARRRGIGSMMLQAIEKHHMASSSMLAASVTSDASSGSLGASFASDPASVAFWAANGYSEFHKGFRRNPRTDTQAVAVMKTNDHVVAEVLATARRIYLDNQHWITSALMPDEHATSKQDRSILERYSSGQRSTHDTSAALRRLALLHGLPPPFDKHQVQALSDQTLRSQVASLL